MAWPICTGSLAAATAVFIRMPSTPCSMVTHASEAVPTPASTITGTFRRRLMVRTLAGLRSPSRADGGGEGHDGRATRFFEPQRRNQVLIRVRQDLEPFGHQGAGGLEQTGDVREQGFLVADHFELHEVIEACLAGEARVPHRLVGGVAARGVGEQEEPLGIQILQDAAAGRAIEIHAPDRDGDDVRPRRFDGADHGLVVPVLAGTDHQAGAEGLTAHDEGNVHQPPPTNCTSSILSPGSTRTSPSEGRRTILRLCSTTTARGSSDQLFKSSRSVAPAETVRGAPFTTISTPSPSLSPAPRGPGPARPTGPGSLLPHTRPPTRLPARWPGLPHRSRPRGVRTW